MKICQPVDKIVTQLPPQSVYEQYGRVSKLLIHPKDVPQILLELFNERQQVEESEESEKCISMMVNSPDESRSQEGTSTTTSTDELCVNEVFMIDSKENVPVLVDTCNESRNLFQDVDGKDHRRQKCWRTVSTQGRA